MTEPTRDARSERKVFWSSVGASVVASIIVIILIQPLLSSFWTFLSSTGSDYLARLVDQMYKNAALGNRNWVVAVSAIVLLYVPFVNVIVLAVVRPLLRKMIARRDDDRKSQSIIQAIGALIVLTVLGLSVATPLASFIYTDLQLNASFEQRLHALAPHITDQQVKVLKADWALMTSKSDYLKIKDTMDLLASKANVKLPALLLSD